MLYNALTIPVNSPQQYNNTPTAATRLPRHAEWLEDGRVGGEREKNGRWFVSEGSMWCREKILRERAYAKNGRCMEIRRYIGRMMIRYEHSNHKNKKEKLPQFIQRRGTAEITDRREGSGGTFFRPRKTDKKESNIYKVYNARKLLQRKNPPRDEGRKGLHPRKKQIKGKGKSNGTGNKGVGNEGKKERTHRRRIIMDESRGKGTN